MQFTYDESVHLIEQHTDRMVEHIGNPLRYQLRMALYTIINNKVSQDQLDEAYEDGREDGRNERNEVSYEDGYDKGWDDAYKEIERAQ